MFQAVVGERWDGGRLRAGRVSKGGTVRGGIGGAFGLGEVAGARWRAGEEVLCERERPR